MSAKKVFKNIFTTVGIFVACLCLCVLIQSVFSLDALVPAVLVLGIFLTALVTDGYAYGIASAVLGVICINVIFTYPFMKMDYSITGNIISGAIFAVIALLTCALTTKLKNQEALKREGEMERMRANLLRAVSHDLRTPLTTIYGSSSALLEDSGFSAEQTRSMIAGIKEDSEWLIRLVENLLSITRIDSGNVSIQKTNIVLDELVDSILVKFAKRYPHQEVCVDLPNEFIVIPMDAILIEQVAINILDNAVQHAEGMTKLSFKVSAIRDKVIFEIRDNGCGIPREKLSDIFSGYSSPGTFPSDGRRKNAGIGLSVCAAIIRAHGGEIRAENVRGGGAAFRFTLLVEEENVK